MKSTSRSFLRQFDCRHALFMCLSTILFTSGLFLQSTSAAFAHPARSLSTPSPFSTAHPARVQGGLGQAALLRPGTVPPSDADCLSTYGIDCYSPQAMRHIYNITPLIDAGFTGKGQTIVVIDSYGSPTIQQDLKTFDTSFGLPDPPSFQVIAPLGTVPFDDTNADMDSWALEATIDVEWSHAIAPDASIVLMTSPVDETQGIQGLPEFLQLEQYALDHHLGNIISQSWGTAENTLFTAADQHIFSDYDTFYQKAAAQHVTILGVPGDFGAANPDANGNFYTTPTVQFPGSSPYVTTVGGTVLKTDANFNYVSETVWNASSTIFATGGGVSQHYKEPVYQSTTLPTTTASILKGYRGVPDVAYNASAITSILLYFSFRGASKAGFYNVGGTSEGAPQWAGITAIADQYGHRSLGFLNPGLYRLGSSALYSKSFHDVTTGNNTTNGVTGYDATTGWDPTTGWGTPNLGGFIKALCDVA